MIYDVKDVAKILQSSEIYVNRLCRKKRIPHCKYLGKNCFTDFQYIWIRDNYKMRKNKNSKRTKIVEELQKTIEVENENIDNGLRQQDTELCTEKDREIPLK